MSNFRTPHDSISHSANHFHEPFMSGRDEEINPCLGGIEEKSKQTVVVKKPHPLGKTKPIRRRLKREHDLFQNDFIEYNVEAPNRVAMRLEYLIGSTKVKLNDRRFMDKLYGAISNEEDQDLKITEHKRALEERDRVKILVVEGEMPPPKDLTYLYNHPIFRVNAILRRLEKHELTLNNVPKPKAQITPCEPFEFDAGKYFRHLHRTGRTDWIPKSVRKQRREKLKAKIQRAKERKLRRDHPSEFLQQHFSKDHYHKTPSSAEVDDFGEEVEGENEEEDDELMTLFIRDIKTSVEAKLKEEDEQEEAKRAARVKSFLKSRRDLNNSKQKKRNNSKNSNDDGENDDDDDDLQRLLMMKSHQQDYQIPTSSRPQEQQQLREELMHKREEEREAKLLLRRKELEAKLVQDKQKRLESQFDLKKNIVSTAIMKDLHNKSKQQMFGINIDEKELELLKHCYKLEDLEQKQQQLTMFEAYKDKLVQNYLLNAEDADTLFFYGHEIKLLYDRKEKITAEFVKAQIKFMEMQKFKKL